MEVTIGRFRAQVEVPEPIKFAFPIMLLGDLFTTVRHLAVALGYFATIGWETCAPDLRSEGSPSGFGQLVDWAGEAAAALAREPIVVGHGIGGLAALKLAERSTIKAGVALAPLVPGWRTPLLAQSRIAAIWRRGRALRPPTGRVLFDFVADADPFTRQSLIKGLVAENIEAALEVARGRIEFGRGGPDAAPRLIVAGDSDPFAPLDKTTAFAESIGVPIKTVAGRGHWLIGGRALERAAGEAHRFLVRSLGEQLLLLYPDAINDEPPDESA